MRRTIWKAGALAAAFVIVVCTHAQAQQQKPASEATTSGKPNILVIFGDDVGITNISVYSDGLMGYETPNIDRIAREGIRFLHYYGMPAV